MKVLITGATGLIGQALTINMLNTGHNVVILSRQKEKVKHRKKHLTEEDSSQSHCHVFEWGELDSLEFIHQCQEVDALVHLAGAPIAEKRWTAQQKVHLYRSRMETLKTLQLHFLKLKKRDLKLQLKSIISASAIGFYGPSEEWVDESTPSGEGYLAHLCQKMELSAKEFASTLQVRDVQVRIGLVMAKGAGFLSRMEPFARKGFLGPLAKGQQWMSWIHMEDLIEVFREALLNDDLQGPINGVSPDPVKNIEFTKMLNRQMGMPTAPSVPAFVLKMAFGEMAQMLITGQRVAPKKLEAINFKFSYASLPEALESLYSR